MTSIIGSVLILGLTGMVAQIVLLRELLVVFSGNELYIGIFMSLWGAGEALGALWGERQIQSQRPAAPLFAFGSTAFSILLPCAILLVRCWKTVLAVPPELSSGISVLQGVSAAVLLPVAIIHGFLFISACKIISEVKSYSDDAVAITYSWETIGSVLGGVLTSFVLLGALNSFQIALLLAIINSVASAVLLKKNGSTSTMSKITALCGVIFSLLLLSGFGNQLHQKSISRQWGGRNPVSYKNSHYQNIVVMESAGQYTLFTDGIPQITLPVPDIESLEEKAHIPLLVHPQPIDILIIGGGAGGLIAETVKHPSIKKIDYLESDPAILRSIKELPANISGGELENPRVNILHEDGTVFLRNTQKKYDVVIINIPLPETLQSNRFFTRQFFNSVTGVLNDKGIFAISSKGSLTYYSPELRLLNASLGATLKAVFPVVEMVPGDNNLFLASKTDLAGLDAGLMARRKVERNLDTLLLTTEHFFYRLNDKDRRWAIEEISKSIPTINDDFNPSLMYQNLSYTSLINSSIITRVLGVVNQRNVAAAGTVLGAVLLILIFFRRISCRAAVSFTVATTGMSSMIGGVLLMSAFQVFYGNLFHHMGMLLALLMAGIGTGSYLAAAKIVRRNSDRTVMLSIEFSMAILLLAQAISLNFLQQHPHENVSMIPILSGIFLIGLLTGVTYPVASRLYRDACHTVGVSEVPISTKGAGFVYAADLFGGCFGGVLGALVLIPALGIKGSFILMGILKMATALTFACSWGFLQKRAIR